MLIKESRARHLSTKSPLGYYPQSYWEARERFQAAAEQASAEQASWPITARGPAGEALSMQVARWGSPQARRWLLLTTGLHGSEAPFGSAVVLRLLHELRSTEPAMDTSILLVHGLNPYGYAWVRRANEDNIDLNRNALLPGEEYRGVPPLYHYVYNAFDPHCRRAVSSFYLQAWWLILRFSKAALQSSLPVGQYEYPRGLFYGGRELAESLRVVQQNVPEWMPQAEEIMHLDFHTGLGRWAGCKLLMDYPESHQDADWIQQWAPAGSVESAASNRTAYHARGSLGPWMKHVVFPEAHYRYAAAEFGTYGSVMVLRSLVLELQAHFSHAPESRFYRWAKRRLRETFVPGSFYWRKHTLEQGFSLCKKAYAALAGELVSSDS